MNREQFDILLKKETFEPIKGSDLSDQTDRTVLYGYTCDRKTFSVDLVAGKLVIEISDFNDGVESLTSEDDITDNNEYVPNKRVYPAKSDFEFCSILKNRGVEISFTTFE